MELYDYLKEKGFGRLLDEPPINPSHSGRSQNYEQLFEGYLRANEPKTFDEAARPLIRWLCENKHPHVKAIITSTSSELLEGLESNPGIYDYLVD